MIETTSASFGTRDALNRAVRDLVALGIPRRTIRVNDLTLQMLVIGPEIVRFLKRHEPLLLQRERRLH